MRFLTFRARVALWSVAVVTLALTLFAVGAAWNLRRELVDNVDQEIQDTAAAFAEELDEQQAAGGQWTQGFAEEDLPRFPYVEVRNATRLLYRSPALGTEDAFPREPGEQPNEITLLGQTVRFRVFKRGGITFALGQDLHSVDEALSGLLHSYLIILPMVALAVGAGGWLVARRAVAPIQAITEQAQTISAFGLGQRIPVMPTQDEIGHLTRVLNDMFDRLQQSFEQVTRFTSDASHELKTPLALMQAEIENALQSIPDAAAPRELLSSVSEQCTRLSQIVDGLLLLSRADDRHLALDHAPVDLVRLVNELMEDAEILAEPAALTLETRLDLDLLVAGDGRLLARGVMNLIDNAIKYNIPGGQILISLTAQADSAVLHIGNSGPGILGSAEKKIFDRFYRGDLSHSDATPGHGLGLSIAREIARAHGGDVSLLQTNSQWTEFSFVLPLRRPLSLHES
ncbi:MAG: HAMP domain-containing protein [Chthoniobacterales bacterium]|nr:HAMP domain-containing protein [Chthoniobacterales bacterium]